MVSLAQAIIYANGETSGSSFHLISEWKGDGTRHTYGPTIASATYTYPLSTLPAGSKVTSVIVYARIGVGGNPNGGYASGYPKANGVSFQQVSGSSDKKLYSAQITFENISASTKVTFSFKSGGFGLYSGSHSGTASFDDVYLLVEYILPCSDWIISPVSGNIGETIYADVILTDNNLTYSHKVVITCENSVLFEGRLSSGETRVPILLDSSWLEYYPDAVICIAHAVLETYNESGVLLGVSDPVQIEFYCPDTVVPFPGTISITGNNMFGGQVYVQGISSASISASEWSGSCGSLITSVTLSGNGKTVTKDFSSEALPYTNNLVINSGLLNTPGPVTFTLSVTDSRGRFASISRDIYVSAYAPISIASTAQGRITNNASDMGDTGYVRVDYTHSSGISYTFGDQTVWNTPV